MAGTRFVCNSELRFYVYVGTSELDTAGPFTFITAPLVLGAALWLDQRSRLVKALYWNLRLHINTLLQNKKFLGWAGSDRLEKRRLDRQHQ